MFRLQDNTPEVYVNNSRDFQLFCRVYDCLVNGVRFDINSMTNVLDAMTIKDNMLPLLCTKLGFFTKENIPNDVLRVILKSFPYAIKNKGSVRGIQYAVCAILKMEGTFEIPEIIIDNDEYIVRIYTQVDIINKKPLKAYLEYIVPLGYDVSIERYVKYIPETTSLTTNITSEQTSQTLQENNLISVVRGTNTIEGKPDKTPEYVGQYEILQIIGSENQPKTGSGGTI